jgi:uncharacterized membrane protein YfcA
LILFLPPRSVVPLILFLSNFSNILVVAQTRRWIQLRRFLPLMVTGVIGAAAGTRLLARISAETMTVAIGVVSILSSLALLVGWSLPVRNERLGLAWTGLLSGILGGSTSMSGPPVVLFLANQGVEKQVFRANTTLYFIVMSLSTLPSQFATSLVTRQLVAYAALLLPVLVAGTLVGIRLSGSVSEGSFRRLILAVVTLAGAFSIASGLGLI